MLDADCLKYSQYFPLETVLLFSSTLIRVLECHILPSQFFRSMFRRFLYSGMGLLTMTAFCYPYEAIAVTRIAVEHGKVAWNDFVRCKLFFIYIFIDH